MKEKIISVTISIIIIIFLILFIFSNKLEFSENENRYLEKFPNFNFEDLIDNKYLKNIDSYLQDHFVFRDEFIKIRTNYLMLLNYKEVNNVFINNKMLIEKYIEPKKTEKLINKLNFIEENVNKKIDLMLVPTSISIYKELLPNYYINNQIETMNYIYDNVNMNKISVYNTLIEHKDEKMLYYSMDHHWNIYGAYYAYLEYCKYKEMDCFKLEDFNIEEVEDTFKGTIYSKVLYETEQLDKIYKVTKDDVIVKYPDSVKNTLYEEKYLNLKDKYSYYLNNNNSIIEIETNNINNKSILIVKDSYANCFIPFLTSNYKKIVIIDPRYYKLSILDYIKSNNFDDILFLYNMNTIDNDGGIYTID